MRGISTTSCTCGKKEKGGGRREKTGGDGAESGNVGEDGREREERERMLQYLIILENYSSVLTFEWMLFDFTKL